MICAAICACILYACVKELEESRENNSPDELITGKNTELTMAAARQWYNANNQPVVELRSGKKKDGSLVMPIWEKAKERKRGKRYEVVEMPLKTQLATVWMDKETRDRVNWEEDGKKIRNIVHLVILKDLKTGNTRSFIMVFIGSYDYLMKTKTFGKNSYLYREPDFDGSVLFFEQGKGMLNGWIYKNGKIKNEILPKPGEADNPFQLRSEVCWKEVEYITYQECENANYYEWDAEYGGYVVVIVPEVCHTEYVPNYITKCEDSDCDDDSGWITPPPPPPPDTTPNTPNDPCGDGKAGNTNNNNMISDSTIKTQMDSILKDKVTSGAYNEWSVSIGKNGNTYTVSNAEEGTPTSSPIPYIPNMVAFGHYHTAGAGVPSNEDLYVFLEKVRDNPNIETMYTYGKSVCDGYGAGGTETYAINVYDREAVRTFLASNPKSENIDGFFHTFIDTKEVGAAYNNILDRVNHGGYDNHNPPYYYTPEAIALSYIMNSFNMGVTLSRSVSCGNFYNSNFEILDVLDINTTPGNSILDITTCQ